MYNYENTYEVSIMLFRKNKEKMCCLCTYSSAVDEDTIQCSKRGIKRYDDKCIAFRYDPCKRIPKKAKALDVSKYEEYDYSL